MYIFIYFFYKKILWLQKGKPPSPDPPLEYNIFTSHIVNVVANDPSLHVYDWKLLIVIDTCSQSLFTNGFTDF